MTKEEKIKEVYENRGFTWLQVKDYIDEDGWTYHEVGNSKVLTDELSAVSWRPEELFGIGHNNGWKSLEMQEFPEDIDSVFWFNNDNGEYEVASLLHCDFNYKDYTHWHTLPPKPPIY